MGNGRKGDATSQGPKVTSQIPGLSGRRLGIYETDSNYVKLAKQGGHKGLLWHEETSSSETIKTNSPYKPPDWFSIDSDDHASPSPTKTTSPGFLVHEEFQKTAKKSIQPLNSPFGGDNKSAWEREADSIATEETHGIDTSASQLKKLTISPKDSQEVKNFRKLSLNKNPAPISMSKLLSFGYLEEDQSPTGTPEHSAAFALTDGTVPLELSK